MADKGNNKGSNSGGRSFAAGIVAGGNIKANRATTVLQSDGESVAVGTAAGGTYEVEQQRSHLKRSQAKSDGTVGDSKKLRPSDQQSPGDTSQEPCSSISSPPSSLSSAGKTSKVASSSKAPAKLLHKSTNVIDMMKELRNLPPGNFEAFADEYQANNVVRKSEYEDGAKGVNVGPVARNVNITGGSFTQRVIKARESEKGFWKEFSTKFETKFFPDGKGETLKPQGRFYALMINNLFPPTEDGSAEPTVPIAPPRKGAQYDRQLLNFLKDELGFDVTYHQDVKSTAKDLEGKLQDFIDKVKTNVGLLFVIVSSHGGSLLDSVLMADGKDACAYRHIMYKFAGKSIDMKRISRIPKVFLFNMCRDSWQVVKKKMAGDNSGGSGQSREELDNTLAIFTTLPYKYSTRDEDEGSCYISALTQAFKDKWQTGTLFEILRDTHYLVATEVEVEIEDEEGKTEIKEMVQVPEIRNIAFLDDLKFAKA